MVFKSVSNLEKGITLAEIVVVIFIIGLLLMILVSGFPEMQRQFSLSRATYKFAQDLRRVQDLALSGYVAISNVKGYGVYTDLSQPKQYIIYADRGDGDQKYNVFNTNTCDKETNIQNDCIVEKIDLSKDAPGVVIDSLYNVSSNSVSINFSPPNPTVSISDLAIGQDLQQYDRAGIKLMLEADPASQRTIYIWMSGLIQAQ